MGSAVVLAGSAAGAAHVEPMAAESAVAAVPAACHAAEPSDVPLEKMNTPLQFGHAQQVFLLTTKLARTF